MECNNGTGLSFPQSVHFIFSFEIQLHFLSVQENDQRRKPFMTQMATRMVLFSYQIVVNELNRLQRSCKLDTLVTENFFFNDLIVKSKVHPKKCMDVTKVRRNKKLLRSTLVSGYTRYFTKYKKVEVFVNLFRYCVFRTHLLQNSSILIVAFLKSF